MSKLNFISHFFFVSNINDSVAYYVNKLGFEVWYTGPDDGLFWAMVGRGPVSIMLKAIADDIKPIPNYTRHEWARWDAFIHTAEPDALFDEYRSGDVIFRQSIQNDGDGLRGFEIADADGYVLFFGRPIA